MPLDVPEEDIALLSWIRRTFKETGWMGLWLLVTLKKRPVILQAAYIVIRL